MNIHPLFKIGKFIRILGVGVFFGGFLVDLFTKSFDIIFPVIFSGAALYLAGGVIEKIGKDKSSELPVESSDQEPIINKYPKMSFLIGFIILVVVFMGAFCIRVYGPLQNDPSSLLPVTISGIVLGTIFLYVIHRWSKNKKNKKNG